VSTIFEGERVALTDLYQRLALVRAFETRVGELYRANRIPGFVHTSLGQEAVAVGVCSALRPTDYLTTTHRGHGHVLAKGASVDAMMAELFGKATGLCGGKGGSMHVADPRLGILGANAIVGAGLPIAVGAALASKRAGDGRVTVAFFGEGAVNQGMFHEAVNLAAIWDAPVIFACENNLYSEFTDSRTMSRVDEVAARCTAYGVPSERIDGNDVELVFDRATAAADRCRSGAGPVLLEFETYRWMGHYEGDPQRYKPKDEVAEWRARDPLELVRLRLLEQGSEEAELAGVVATAETRVQLAIDAAEAADDPDVRTAYEHV
jgi:TPP-dependent pyruvate/acetoin dehydrogenase alpha subunit